ncbi:MAG: Gfo/Idh/MocA family protein [Planctomycetota bacterium]
MEPVKLGVIGCGVIGKTNLKAAMASDLVDVVAAADLRVERREWAREQGVGRIYEDGRDLIDKDPEVEAVLISFPASTRTAMALRAFARGKHVITEKPVALNAREVRSLIAARGDRVAACLSSRVRMCASAEKATEVVKSGALGPIRHIHVRALRAGGPRTDKVPPPWRESFCMNAGGILTNWSCYDLDYVLGVTGWYFRPKTVLGQWWPCVPEFRCHVAPDSDADSYFTAMAVGEDGSVLTIERGEFMPAPPEEAWQVIGTKGSVTLGMTGSDDRRITHHDGSAEKGVVSKVIWEGKDPKPSGNPLVIEDFASAVRDGRAPATGLEQALTIMQITDAIYASAERGAAVDIR